MGLCFCITVHQLSKVQQPPVSHLNTMCLLPQSSGSALSSAAYSPTLQNYVSLALIVTCTTRICNYVSVTVSPAALHTQALTIPVSVRVLLESDHSLRFLVKDFWFSPISTVLVPSNSQYWMQTVCLDSLSHTTLQKYFLLKQAHGFAIFSHFH